MKRYGITGWKNSGKTGLTERLVTEFTARGLRVATVKHAHGQADIDVPGTDSFRHRTAGAGQVILATPDRWALMTELRGAAEPSLDELVARLDPHDLVLIEGFKGEAHPKVECHRAEAATKPLIAEENRTIRCVASDSAIAAPHGLQVLDLNDTAAIADFLWEDLS